MEEKGFGEQYFTSVLGGYEYNQVAPLLDAVAGTLMNLTIHGPATVCDIGCAKGFLVCSFRKQGIEAYGADISEYALRNSAKEVSGYLVLCDVGKTHLPFKDNSFDLVTMMETLQFVTDHHKALEEARRILKPNGCMCITLNFKRAVTRNDPYYVNIHDESFWTKEFESLGFHVLYDPSANPLKEAVIEGMQQSEPSPKRIGGILTKYGGRPGRWIRKKGISLVEGRILGAFLLKNMKEA